MLCFSISLPAPNPPILRCESRIEPRKGFDHWVSFKGQGAYFDPELNINGARKTIKGYTTDVLTAEALRWLNEIRDPAKPFLLYLSFKAVHFPFTPAPRHAGRYRDKAIDYPETMALTEENYATQPRWVRERRYGIHGIDHMQTGALDKDPVPDFDQLYWNYCETVHGLDENVGRVLDRLDATGLSKSTITLYLSDNGFELGEHGFYDKRDAFEESIRIPMLAYAPGVISPVTEISEMVLNIDVSPTILAHCGLPAEAAGKMDGRSFDALLRGKSDPAQAPWRDHILYEYHWEWNFPATPTTLAIRGDRYKYIYYHGIWDKNGFYDLATDPHERHNLIDVPAFQEQITQWKEQLFSELDASGGLSMPLLEPKGEPFHDRKLQR